MAESGSSALQLYKDKAQEIALVLLDLSMPVMDGAECFAKLQELDPTARVLICTGHGKESRVEKMIEKGDVGLIRKPFNMKELSESLETALGLPQQR